MARGGKRAGAGRPMGSRNQVTREVGIAISTAARSYGAEALDTLLDVAQNSSSDGARVSAANALLDRGFGRVVQGCDLVPLSAVDDLQRGMADVVCRNVQDRAVATKIADDWGKIQVEF